jgi:hypothetical protein
LHMGETTLAVLLISVCAMHVRTSGASDLQGTGSTVCTFSSSAEIARPSNG